jgi:siroheme synthase
VDASQRRVSALGEVVLVGTGFSLVTQTTPEAVGAIRRADKLFHLVPDPAAQLWLTSLNASAESLGEHYAEGKLREHSYRDMVDRVLDHVRRGERVCIAFYGHPTVGCDPTQMLIARGRTDGFATRVLPGISSDASLFAELGIDPMDDGMQAYEASRFAQRRPRLDTRAGLVLWQAGFVGEPSIKFSGQANRVGVRLVARLLADTYGASHKVAVYQASWYPFCRSAVSWCPVRSLPTVVTSAGATIYVPPRATPRKRSETHSRR